jgi:hypothetical protein
MLLVTPSPRQALDHLLAPILGGVARAGVNHDNQVAAVGPI